MTSCELCENISGTPQNILVFRRPILDPAPQYHIDRGTDYIHREDCYEFRCRCPLGQAIPLDTWLENEDWTIHNFDSNKHCIHLLLVLTIYEAERLKNLDQELVNPLSLRVYKAATKNMNWEILETGFNTSLTIPGYPQFIQMSEIPFYTVKYKDKKWSCTCNGFYYHKHCKHIKKMQAREDAIQNRRDLGISLATLFNSNK